MAAAGGEEVLQLADDVEQRAELPLQLADDVEQRAELPAAPPPSSSRDYKLHVGAGARGVGELHAEAEGLVGWVRPQSWQLEYRRRWQSYVRGFWQPFARTRLSSGGCDATMRWSRTLLPNATREECETIDGSGLDLNVETTVRHPWSQSQQVGATRSPALSLEQRVELVIGPVGQTKLLNMAFPMGAKVGAVWDSSDHAAEGEKTPWVKVYADLSMPGLQELRGWMGQVELADSLLGLLRTHVQSVWSRSPPSFWSVEHLRTWGPVPLPRLVSDSVHAAGSVAAGMLEGLVPVPQAPTGMAVVPVHRLRAGTGGPSAGLTLDSSQSGLGGSGWGSGVEVSRQGWGANLRLAAGNADHSLGQPHYTITAHAGWNQAPHLIHEFKWMFQDGQGLWAIVDKAPDAKPRLNVGMEIR